MKAAVIHKFGDFDALKHEDIERPSPRPGHVLVKVLAAGVECGSYQAITRPRAATEQGGRGAPPDLHRPGHREPRVTTVD